MHKNLTTTSSSTATKSKPGYARTNSSPACIRGAEDPPPPPKKGWWEGRLKGRLKGPPDVPQCAQQKCAAVKNWRRRPSLSVCTSDSRRTPVCTRRVGFDKIWRFYANACPRHAVASVSQRGSTHSSSTSSTITCVQARRTCGVEGRREKGERGKGKGRKMSTRGRAGAVAMFAHP